MPSIGHLKARLGLHGHASRLVAQSPFQHLTVVSVLGHSRLHSDIEATHVTLSLQRLGFVGGHLQAASATAQLESQQRNDASFGHSIWHADTFDTQRRVFSQRTGVAGSHGQSRKDDLHDESTRHWTWSEAHVRHCEDSLAHVPEEAQKY